MVSVKTSHIFAYIVLLKLYIFLIGFIRKIDVATNQYPQKTKKNIVFIFIHFQNREKSSEPFLNYLRWSRANAFRNEPVKSKMCQSKRPLPIGTVLAILHGKSICLRDILEPLGCNLNYDTVRTNGTVSEKKIVEESLSYIIRKSQCWRCEDVKMFFCTTTVQKHGSFYTIGRVWHLLNGDWLQSKSLPIATSFSTKHTFLVSTVTLVVHSVFCVESCLFAIYIFETWSNCFVHELFEFGCNCRMTCSFRTDYLRMLNVCK